MLFASCPPIRLPVWLQFGAGYVLSRLSLLSTSDSALREERCRLLAMLGHLLKLHNRFSLRAGSGGLAELADKVKTAVSAWMRAGCVPASMPCQRLEAFARHVSPAAPSAGHGIVARFAVF